MQLRRNGGEFNGRWTRCPLLLHDNTDYRGAHASSCTSRLVKDIGVEQLSHPPYSTDLAPNDFCLFRRLKQHLCRKWFCNDDEFKQAMDSSRILFDWNEGPFDQCCKCVDVKGDCIEKWCSCFACVVELQNFLIVPRSFKRTARPSCSYFVTDYMLMTVPWSLALCTIWLPLIAFLQSETEVRRSMHSELDVIVRLHYYIFVLHTIFIHQKLIMHLMQKMFLWIKTKKWLLATHLRNCLKDDR